MLPLPRLNAYPLRRLVCDRRCGFRRRLLGRSEPVQNRVGGALARFPGAADRAPQGLVHGFAGKPDRVLHRLHQDPARALSARSRGRKGAKRQRLVVPARRVRTLDRLLHVGAVKAGQPIGGEIDHGRFAMRREVSAERAGNFDHAELRAVNVGQDGGCVRVGRFLETPVRRSRSRADCRRVRARCDRNCRARVCRTHRPAAWEARA